MNKDQIESRANEAKGKAKEVAGKVTGDKGTEYKGKAEKHSSKAGAVLSDVNGKSKHADKDKQ